LKTLYFDLDGTLVLSSFGQVKPRLDQGRFERGVRRAAFQRLVCVANSVAIISALARSLGVGGICSSPYFTHTVFKLTNSVMPAAESSRP
jgi:hypothetical protein